MEPIYRFENYRCQPGEDVEISKLLMVATAAVGATFRAAGVVLLIAKQRGDGPFVFGVAACVESPNASFRDDLTNRVAKALRQQFGIENPHREPFRLTDENPGDESPD